MAEGLRPHPRAGSGVTERPLPDSIAANVAEWTATNAAFTDAQAERAWEPQDLTWGVFGVREDAIGSPLGEVAGLDVVELGCGTAYSPPCLRCVARGRWAWTRPRPSSRPRRG